MNRDGLGGYTPAPGTDQIIEEITTPKLPDGTVQTGQGYWGSPAYWEWGSGSLTRAIYYSVDATSENRPSANLPLPINMYTLQTSGSVKPIPNTYTSTSTLFCAHGGAPVISANGSTPGTGILWAVEASNPNNPIGSHNPNCNANFGPAVLHAYDASNVANTELFHSQLIYQNNISVGVPSNFATPLVFNHRVYMATRTEVDVFGLCSQSLPCKAY